MKKTAVLAVIMALTMLQIPVYVQPSVVVLSLQRNGSDLYVSFVVNGHVYHAFETANSTTITLNGIFDDNGTSQTIPCVDMVPISKGSHPLAIPECGGGGGSFPAAYANFCATFPSLGQCDGSSYFHSETLCDATPYQAPTCEAWWHLFLNPQDAPNAGTDLAGVALLIGAVGFFAAGPAGVIAGLIVGMLSISYNSMYGEEKNADGSMDFFIPADTTNSNDAGTQNPGLYVATNHFWWILFIDIVAENIGTR